MPAIIPSLAHLENTESNKYKVSRMIKCNKEISMDMVNAADASLKQFIASELESNIYYCDLLGISFITSCEIGDNDGVYGYLDRGFDINYTDIRGRTGLIAAKYYDIANKLLRHGADPNLVDNKGKSALYNAVHRGNIDMVMLLVSHRANPNLMYKGKTIIETADSLGLTAIGAVLRGTDHK
jgi:uncharacterized protein